jgi:hypothetical protein
MYCENYEPMPFILAYKQEKSNKIHMISRIGVVAELGRKSWAGQTRAQRFAPKLINSSLIILTMELTLQFLNSNR